MSETELRIEVINTFSQLTLALSEFCNAIKNEPSFMAWVHHCDFFQSLPFSSSAREKACAIFNQLLYLDSQAPREILVCAGFVGSSIPTLKLASTLNECKDRFKKAILSLKEAKISVQDTDLSQQIDSILHREPSASLVLKKMGLSRLHLKQCYRKVPILEACPQKISWTWAHTRSIKKITVAKALELLHKKGDDPGIQLQLSKLAHLNANEPLAIVQELAPHLRANIVFANGNQVKRTMIKGPVPILFPCDEKTPLPRFNPPKEKCLRDDSRSRRCDIRLEDAPFLPAIRAHRYAKIEA